jgi:hypothetical protein
VNVRTEAVRGGTGEVEGGNGEGTSEKGMAGEEGGDGLRGGGLDKDADCGESREDDKRGLHDFVGDDFGPGYHGGMDNMEEDISQNCAGEEGENEHGSNDDVGGDVATVGQHNDASVEVSNRGGDRW